MTLTDNYLLPEIEHVECTEESVLYAELIAELGDPTRHDRSASYEEVLEQISLTVVNESGTVGTTRTPTGETPDGISRSDGDSLQKQDG